MTDATVLRQHLDRFNEAIRKHLELLDDEFKQLEHSWDALRDCYQGAGADRFEAVWTGTSRRFEDYLEQSAALQTVLQERLAALQRYDDPTN